jgi:secreted PhoX family phosphatase
MGGFDSDDLVRSVLFTAGNKIGVRELNRPEDLEYNPFDSNVYIAFTNHNRTTMLNNNGVLGGGTLRPDRSGAVFVLDEAGATLATSSTFTFYAAWLGVRDQGTDDPFVGSCPDNVVIDPEGGVWFGTDGNPGNNGRADSVYYLDLAESKAYRVASAPSDAESTGPAFTPDGNTLFFNVQHPGEGRYSTWPNDSKYGPLSSLVAVYPRR